MKIDQLAIEGAKALGAVCLAFWVALNPVYWILLAVMALDILTGVAAAFVARTLDSSISFRGITKKVMILLMVVLAAILGSNAQVLGISMEIPLGEAVAIYYIANEVLSIIENADRAGIPIPPFLGTALARLNGRGDDT